MMLLRLCSSVKDASTAGPGPTSTCRRCSSHRSCQTTNSYPPAGTPFNSNRPSASARAKIGVGRYEQDGPHRGVDVAEHLNHSSLVERASLGLAVGVAVQVEGGGGLGAAEDVVVEVVPVGELDFASPAARPGSSGRTPCSAGSPSAAGPGAAGRPGPGPKPGRRPPASGRASAGPTPPRLSSGRAWETLRGGLPGPPGPPGGWRAALGAPPAGGECPTRASRQGHSKVGRCLRSRMVRFPLLRLLVCRGLLDRRPACRTASTVRPCARRDYRFTRADESVIGCHGQARLA